MKTIIMLVLMSITLVTYAQRKKSYNLCESKFALKTFDYKTNEPQIIDLYLQKDIQYELLFDAENVSVTIDSINFAVTGKVKSLVIIGNNKKITIKILPVNNKKQQIAIAFCFIGRKK